LHADDNGASGLEKESGGVTVKKCTQCGQILSDDTKFCFKCGGSNYEQAEETGGSYQQPTYQQPVQQPPQQSYYAQQPSYQPQPTYQAQPAYQASGYNDNTQPAKISTFLVFFLLMLIPIFNIIWLIIVAVGGPSHNKSLTNLVRASLIWAAIMIVLSIILSLILGAFLSDLFSSITYSLY
jgi:hypothetical protein